jgi:hypothetical protein
MQIVFAQNEAEALQRKKISAPGITQDMAPAPGFFEPFPSPAGHRRSRSRIDRDAVAATQRSGETGIPIAPRDNFRLRPDLAAEHFQGSAIARPAAGQKHPDPIHLPRQLSKKGAKTIRRRQPKIRRGELSLIDHAQAIRDAFHEDPRGFRSSAFDTEDSL